MKRAHFIEMRVFCKETDDEPKIITVIQELFPFDLKKEKIELKSKITFGFDDAKIKILTVMINKDRHINTVMELVRDRLSSSQRELLVHQLESRLDDSLHFYLRLEKDELLSGRYVITDGGNCFHFKFVIAAFPHKRDVAKKMILEWLQALPENNKP